VYVHLFGHVLIHLFAFAIDMYQWLGLHNWSMCWTRDGPVAVGVAGESCVLAIFIHFSFHFSFPAR